MTGEEARRKAKVMIAYADGKKIEFKSKIHEDSWSCGTGRFDFNWIDYDYRIKPETKTVPYTIEDKELFRGKYVKPKGEIGSIMLIISFNYTHLSLGGCVSSTTYQQLLDWYQFEDGSICGKIQEE